MKTTFGTATLIISIIVIYISCSSVVPKNCICDCNQYKLIKTTYYSLGKIREQYYTCLVDTSRTMIVGWYESGKKRGEAFFHHNKKDSVWTLYNDHAKLAFEGKYYDGNKVDTHKYYSDSGTVKMFEVYDKNGQLIKTGDK